MRRSAAQVRARRRLGLRLAVVVPLDDLSILPELDITVWEFGDRRHVGGAGVMWPDPGRVARASRRLARWSSAQRRHILRVGVADVIRRKRQPNFALPRHAAMY
jgi:hypothetical protein